MRTMARVTLSRAYVMQAPFCVRDSDLDTGRDRRTGALFRLPPPESPDLGAEGPEPFHRPPLRVRAREPRSHMLFPTHDYLSTPELQVRLPIPPRWIATPWLSGIGPSGSGDSICARSGFRSRSTA